MKRGKRYLRTICAFLIAIGVLAGCDNKESVSEDVSVDTSWYESSKTTFTLTKASQLMGLAELSQKNDFKRKTIKLGADIFLNKVDSTTIRQWRSGAKTPSNVWTPLGNFEVPFAGKIDGQGHAISGLYVNVSQEGTGFVGVAASSVELLNIRFVDGYIKNKSNYTGIIGYGLVKRIEDVYTNLIIETEACYTGGFIGWYQGGYHQKLVGALIGGLEGEGLTITNCYGIGEKVIGQIKENVELELSDDSLKTLEEIAKLDISTALPKLEWELISPWRKKEGFVPVLRGIK